MRLDVCFWVDDCWSAGAGAGNAAAVVGTDVAVAADLAAVSSGAVTYDLDLSASFAQQLSRRYCALEDG